jgi:hypothetical protein
MWKGFGGYWHFKDYGENDDKKSSVENFLLFSGFMCNYQ